MPGPQPSQGTACWHELMTPDTSAAKKFYSELFGWQPEDKDMGGFTYTIYKRGEEMVAGMMSTTGPEWQGVPPHWMIYYAVDNVDAACEKIKQLGGKVCVPPTDIPNIGRFAVVNDPQGATFSVFKGT